MYLLNMLENEKSFNQIRLSDSVIRKLVATLEINQMHIFIKPNNILFVISLLHL